MRQISNETKIHCMRLPFSYELTTHTRYLFNGMEADNEVKGNGNSYTTEYRQYDPRLGRWLCIDPMASLRISLNPYNSMSNNPISRIDPKGNIDDNYTIHEDGKIQVEKTNDKTDNFKYVNNEGLTTDLGTYEKNNKGLIDFPAKSEGIVRYGPNDKKGDHWVNPKLAAILFGVGKLRKDNGQSEIQIGDLSNSEAVSPNTSHKSHKNGNNADIRLVREDEKNLPTNVNNPNFSLEKSQELVDQLKLFGAKTILSYPNNEGIILKGTTMYPGHKDHLHITNYEINEPAVISLPEIIVKP